ncbi:MAG: DUF151 domain-containing protein [Chloroflexi bacterium]|nr:DUF151 domain-containing protein [Chloroflexota bacterium]
MNQPPTDRELVALCLGGDTLAFGRLIDRHRVPLARLLHALLRDRFAQEDVWQETLLRAYLNLEQLREPAHFGRWLYRIALNLARTQRNQHWSQASSWDGLSTPDAEPIEPADPTHLTPEARAIRQEANERVRQAIASLPPAERDAVMLVYLDELSHQEAALRLGASLSAIKVRVHRGRERLRTVLQAEFATNSKQLVKEPKMIKVTVHDIVRPIKRVEAATDGEQPAQPSIPNEALPHSRVILLKAEDADRAFPIWVGLYEGEMMAMYLLRREVPRPMMYELLKTLLDLGQMTLEQVVINRLHEKIFYSNLILKTGATITEIDCRPSDAVNLALRLGVPIFVAEEVMEQTGNALDATLDPAYVWESVLDKPSA